MMAADAPPLSLVAEASAPGIRVCPDWVGAGVLGGRAWLPAYAFECKQHGVVVSYGQGFEGLLVCPLCESWEASG